MQVIPIKHRNGTIDHFTVSDDDYEWVTQWNWSISTINYVVRHSRKCEGGNPRMIYLHRALMEHHGHDLAGLVIDHIDGRATNNCRENLRPCLHSQNIAAQRSNQPNKASQYRGVHWFKRAHKWTASVRESGKNRSLGYFVSEDDAARAYNAAALRVWGEFAVLNDVPVIQLELPLEK